MKHIRSGAAVVAVVVLTVLTGCTSSGTTPTGSPTDVTASLVNSLPAGTKAVGSVTWGLSDGEPNSLDPKIDTSVVFPNLCDNLLKLNPDFSISPNIATSAKWADPATFVIELRDDVKFWDGNPVTPADVVYSLSRNRDPNSQYYGAFAFVTGIDATGAHEVTIHFSQPESDFYNTLSDRAGAVMEKAYGDSVGDKVGTQSTGLMCTGPYELAAGGWTPGKQILTRANPNYWNGKVLVKQLTYEFTPDSTALTNALLTGEVDGAFNVATSARAQFASSTTGKLYVGNSTGTIGFGPTTDQGAAALPAIRQALSLAVDRKQFINVVLGGLGYESKTFVPPFTWSGSPEKSVYDAGYAALPSPTLDLEKARHLVASSGIDVSKPLTLAIPAGNTLLSQTGAIIQAAAQSIGLVVKIDEKQPADFGAMFYNPSARQGDDFIATNAYIESPAFLGYAALFLVPANSGGIYNWSNYSNDAVTGPLLGAQAATDAASAASAYVTAQAAFAPDNLQVTLAGYYQTSYLQNNLSGIVTSIAIYSTPWALALGGK